MFHVFDVIQSVKGNTFKSGVQTFGLQNNGVGIAAVMKGVPQSVVTAVNQLKQDIIDGKIQVSTTVQK